MARQLGVKMFATVLLVVFAVGVATRSFDFKTTGADVTAQRTNPQPWPSGMASYSDPIGQRSTVSST